MMSLIYKKKKKKLLYSQTKKLWVNEPHIITPDFCDIFLWVTWLVFYLLGGTRLYHKWLIGLDPLIPQMTECGGLICDTNDWMR